MKGPITCQGDQRQGGEVRRAADRQAHPPDRVALEVAREVQADLESSATGEAEGILGHEDRAAGLEAVVAIAGPASLGVRDAVDRGAGREALLLVIGGGGLEAHPLVARARRERPGGDLDLAEDEVAVVGAARASPVERGVGEGLEAERGEGAALEDALDLDHVPVGIAPRSKDRVVGKLAERGAAAGVHRDRIEQLPGAVALR